MLSGNSELNGNKDVAVIGTDSTGHLQWASILGETGLEDVVTVTVTSEGNPVIGAMSSSYSSPASSILLLKFEPEGALVWSKWIHSPTSSSTMQFKATKDGGFISIGSGHNTLTASIDI